MNIPLADIRRALVIKLAHFGDVLLAAPVVSVLKRRMPHAEIDALVYAETAPMLSGHPDVSRLFQIRRRALGAEIRLLGALRARRYELMVALSDKPRIAWLSRISGARYAVSPQRSGRPGFWRSSFTHFYRLPPGNTRHTVEVNLDALRAIGIEPQPQETRVVLVPGPQAERRIDGLALPRRFIVVHPGSRWLFKCWPARRAAELIDRLQRDGERVVLTGAPDQVEKRFLDELRAALRSQPIDLAGQLDLKELAALIARARLFVGFDSAPLHIASAMGTPAVVLFGPSGEIEWGPWHIPYRILTSNHPCRPCGHNGCGGGERSECIETIGVQAVASAVERMLREASAAHG